MNDHDVIVALVAFDALFLLIVCLLVIRLAPVFAQIDRDRRARHARPKADAQ